MIVAYELNPYDGGSHFFEDRRMSIMCPACNALLVKDYLPTDVKPLKKWDISSSYDNRIIVTDRFKIWYERQGFGELGFRRVFETPTYFVFEPAVTLRVDPQCAIFSEKCPQCGSYAFVKTRRPFPLLDTSSPLTDGFYRSDIEFGGGREQTPSIFVGIRTMELLKQERFRLFDFEPVLGPSVEDEAAPRS